MALNDFPAASGHHWRRPLKGGEDARQNPNRTNMLDADAQALRRICMDLSHRVRALERHPCDAPEGSGSAQMFRLRSVQDDYVTCRALSGHAGAYTEGETDVLLAKPYKLRESLDQDYVAGELHTYEYVSGPDGDNRRRNNTVETTTDGELVTPAWVVPTTVGPTTYPGEIVYGLKCQTGVWVAGFDVGWLLISPFRQWAKIYGS